MMYFDLVVTRSVPFSMTRGLCVVLLNTTGKMMLQEPTTYVVATFLQDKLMEWAAMLFTDGEGDNTLKLQCPCQIECFISIGLLNPTLNYHLVDGQAITEGPQFIFQLFQEEPQTITSPATKLIQRGKLEKTNSVCIAWTALYLMLQLCPNLCSCAQM